jgi:hypothetical protein
LLGKILRIDLGNSADGLYTISTDNPFVGIVGDDEIWAYGLRNPWRCSFDAVSGEFWIADVGQGAWEEINLQPAGVGGQNYGWRVMEGNHSTGRGGGPPAFDPSLRAPIHEYPHDDMPFRDWRICLPWSTVSGIGWPLSFADFAFGTIWSLARGPDETVTVVNRTGEMTPDVGSIRSISSFAEDGTGELYVIDQADG